MFNCSCVIYFFSRLYYCFCGAIVIVPIWKEYLIKFSIKIPLFALAIFSYVCLIRMNMGEEIKGKIIEKGQNECYIKIDNYPEKIIVRESKYFQLNINDEYSLYIQSMWQLILELSLLPMLVFVIVAISIITDIFYERKFQS